MAALWSPRLPALGHATRRTLGLAFLMFMAFSGGTVFAAVRYVNAARPDDSGNGLSWAAAEKTLQAALADAVSGDEVWVAAGTYKPDQGPGVTPGDRMATFQLLNGVALYGGFAGVETLLSQRNSALNVTILSGDLPPNDMPVPCIPNSSDCNGSGGLCVNNFCIISANNELNSFHVTNGLNTNATAVLDGFTISGGNANGAGTDSNGGGLLNNSGSVTVRQCVFIGNQANAGGGIYNAGSTSAISNCQFIGNLCGLGGAGGGGIWNDSSTPTVTNSTFKWNRSATGPGGGPFSGGAGMYNLSSNSTVSNCTFEGNDSDTSGGGMRNNGASPVLSNCIFTENVADSGGGGMFNVNSSNPMITDCTFRLNATSDDGGGMINHTSSSPTVTNCVFDQNMSNLGDPDNGGGGMANEINSNPIVTGCTFTGNVDSATVNGGGGMYNLSSSPVVTNCWFTGNTAVGGGAVYNASSSPILDDCTFVGNSETAIINSSGNPKISNCDLTMSHS